MLTQQRVEQAIELVKRAMAEHNAQAAKIRAVGGRLRVCYLASADEALEALRPLVARHRRIGSPPSFVRVAGQASLEKPLNRLLAWWCRDAEHGAGLAFVRRLAAHVALEVMVDDLDAGRVPAIRAEEGLEGDAARQPDLVVTTKRAALLLENKLHAGESGDQYGPYLEVFRRDSAGLESRAVLCSRSARELPSGWDCVLRHADVARLFEDLAHEPTLSFWARASAAVTAVAFAEERPMRELVAEADALLRAERASLSPADVARSRELVRALGEMPLWIGSESEAMR